MVILTGIPYDEKSSFLRGAALAPARIRETLHNGASNYYTEDGFNAIEHAEFLDGGDIEVSDYEDISEQVLRRLGRGRRVLVLGGDHSITYPVVKACSKVYGRFDILHVDAHGDLYEEFEGDRYSHACPFARIMEAGLARRLVQVGLRSLTPHQRQQAERYGVEQIEMRHFEEKWRHITFDGPLYLSVDLDAFDPAFAPGVSHHEPGGLTPRQFLDILHVLQVPLIGADIVEYNPHRDHAHMTAALAAKLLREIAAKMLRTKP